MHRVIQPDAERSRLNSSDQYVSLIKEYEKMHGSGEGIFNGRSLLKFVDIIDGYLQNNDCKSVLDYGCGKGHLYTDKFTTIQRRLINHYPNTGVLKNINCLILPMKNIQSYPFTRRMQLYVQMYWNISLSLILVG